MTTVQIEDGRGSGLRAEVDPNFHLVTNSIVRFEQHFINHDKERYWSMPFDAIDPTDADDYFLYIKYTGSGTLHIPEIKVTSTVAGFIEPQHVTGAAVSGAEVTLVNRHLGSTKTPDGNYQTAVNITGLADAGHLEHEWLQANIQTTIGDRGHIIIPPGEAFALLWTVSTGILSGAVKFYEDEN